MTPLENISIVVATNNNFCVLLAALIKSIELNHKTAEKLDLYIINDGISTENIQRLKNQINPSTTTIIWLTPNEIIPTEISVPLDHSTFPATAYLRVFAPDVLPKSVKKMLYLDADMIVYEDISKLWHTNLGDKICGGVVDLAEVVSASWSGIPNYAELGLPPDTKYFNSGLLLINTERWRAEKIAKKIMECIHQNLKKVIFPDQYGLNVVLANQWYELDARWNSFARLDRKDPYLVHFTEIKPIFKNYNSNPSYKEEFFKYLKQTPWKDFSPISGYTRLYWKALTKIKKKVARFIPGL